MKSFRLKTSAFSLTLSGYSSFSSCYPSSDIFVFCYYNLETAVRLFRLRITCEIFRHFLCTAKTVQSHRAAFLRGACASLFQLMATIDENRELTAHFVQLCPMLVGCEELAVEFKPIRSGDKTNGLTINPCALDVSSLLGFTPFQLSKTTAAA